jgi:ABC-type lipoprotein export system ATPase subunit
MKSETEPAGDLLSASEVAKSYSLGGREISVLRRISLRIRPREAVAIVGASGAGKTTLLNVLGGLDRPTSGSVHFDGRSLYDLPSRERSRLRATRIGFVFQAYHLVPELNLLENVRLASMSGRSAFRGRAAVERSTDLACKVGLQDRLNHRPDELSGGEQQRAAIARALMNDPDLVLADEPTGNLDSATGRQVLHHLFEMVRERRHALVLVTHNEDIAARCDRRLELRDGILEEFPV